MCCVCLYIGCFKINRPCHMLEHSQRQSGHQVFIDLEYGYIYCASCKDYQYNQILEDMYKKSMDKSDKLSFRKFQEWEPSQKVLRLLKNFSDHSAVKHDGHDADNVFELFKMQSSSIIGLRGLLNLGKIIF